MCALGCFHGSQSNREWRAKSESRSRRARNTEQEAKVKWTTQTLCLRRPWSYDCNVDRYTNAKFMFAWL